MDKNSSKEHKIINHSKLGGGLKIVSQMKPYPPPAPAPPAPISS